MLTVRLEENECFSAWVLGSRTNAVGVNPDLKSRPYRMMGAQCSCDSCIYMLFVQSTMSKLVCCLLNVQ